MKTKKPILRLAVFAALSFFTGNELVAQTTVGAACGCPALSARGTAQTIKSYAQSLGKWTDLPSSAYGGEITGDITLTCDKVWTITEKIYVANGATLTIQPGTVVKGTTASSVAAATALIIERGGKINAAGTVDCPIIFTHLDDNLDGTYLLNQIGKWGGVLLCGKATNNLTLAVNGPFSPGASGNKICVADGLGVLEGFASSIPQDQFGAVSGTPSGYTQATSPTGTFMKTATAATAGTATAVQNVSGVTQLIVTAAPTVALNGQSISGTGIAANTTVSGSTTSLTLSNASTAALSGSYVVSTTETGVVAGSQTTELTLASPNPLILTGMAVSGTGITAGTTVVSNSGTTVTLSAAASTLSGTHTFSFTYTAANSLNNGGQNKLNLSSVPTYVVAGCTVTQSSGTEIPANTTIVSISGTVLTLSNNLTGTGTFPTTLDNIQIAVPYASPGVNAYFPTQAVGTTISAPVLYASGTSGAIVNFQSQPILLSSVSGFDDNDNSGVMTYVSLRHTGANLLVGSEINGLTLASVGRATKIEHIEIVSCADDNIEIFGGSVNLKWCTTLFGNDDMFDYDLGWNGKAQFLFGMKGNHQTGTGALSPDGDNGIEADSDDQQSNNLRRSHPIIYNATLIGNAKAAASADNGALAGINAKEMAEGEIYNSIIANFNTGLNIQQAYKSGSPRSNGTGGEAWHNWKKETPSATGTATGASGSNQLSVTPTGTLAVGAMVYGTGIPAVTTITSLNGNVATLSKNLTATAAGTYTFFNTNGSSSTSVPNFANGSESLKIKCNKFLNNAYLLRLNSAFAAITGIAGSGSDDAQLVSTGVTGDNNVNATSITGFNAAFVMTQGTNTITTKNDVIPSVAGGALPAGCSSAVNDGFFSIANYSGAFSPSDANQGSWLSDWSYSQVKNMSSGLTACPTDINNDGITDVNDFLMFSQKFNQSCN
jgi:hypothetical protein